MEKRERQALVNFMIHTLCNIYPNHSEYSYEELRIIEENEGDDSDKWLDYHENITRAYWMKRDIEIISQGTIRF